MKNKMEHYKELLSVMPRNNIKNSRVYLKKALEIKEDVSSYQKKLLEEMEKRYKKITSIPANDLSQKIKENIQDIDNNLYLLNNLNTSYEKSGLNNILYDLGKFYKNDLSKVNRDIFLALEKFKVVGVSLYEKDFVYGSYVQDYMSNFFKEQGSENSSNLKETFDKIYWKCPEIINNIKINFRHLYFKHAKKFEKYYDTRLNELNISDKKEYYHNYKSKLNELISVNSSDIKGLEEDFLTAKLDIKEYFPEKIDKLKKSLLTSEALSSSDSIGDNLLKLSHTLTEYKWYLRFKYIIDCVKTIYSDKNNKTLTKSILKDINKKEKNISKMNSKIKFRKIFNKNASFDKYNSIISNNLIELNLLYKQYDFDNFKEKIAVLLNDKSTLLDIFKLVYSYNINLLKIITDNYEDITQSDIDLEFRQLKEFITYPNNNIVNNITILEEKDIPLIIMDKYKLMGINIDKEMLDSSNLDNLISTVSKVLVSENIEKSNDITVEDINFACEIKKILEKNSN